MAQGKKSFVAYCDWKETFDALPNDKAGELIKHIFAYVNDEDPQTDDVLIKAVFASIKHTLKRDLKKYEEYTNKQRENGKKGGRPPKTNQTQKTQAFLEKPKKADSVSDSDSVNESVSENEKNSSFEEIKEKSFNDLTRDSYFPVEKLADVYLKDEKLSSLVAKHTERSVDDLKNLMPQFVEKLKTENRGVETPGEFAKYFKNILKGNFKLNTPAPKINASEEYCWTWKGQPKIYGSREKYEADKKTWDQPGFGFETIKTPTNE